MTICLEDKVSTEFQNFPKGSQTVNAIRLEVEVATEFHNFPKSSQTINIQAAQPPLGGTAACRAA